MQRMLMALALGGTMLTGSTASAQDWLSYSIDAAYEDAAFDLQTAIENRGYVINDISHVGDMLNRTAADVGATTQIYDHADVYQFCSAVLSRKMMEADPMNIAFCPYGIFLFQRAGDAGVTIGYRRMPDGAMQEVDALLHEIVREVAGVQ